MRAKLAFLWLAAGIALFCLHYGPGQQWLRTDRARALAAEARRLEKAGQAEAARGKYEAALNALSEEGDASRRTALRIARAWTYLNTENVSEATAQLEEILTEVRTRQDVAPKVVADVQSALAHAEYYTAWHLRLENAPRDQWLKELDVARRNFRHLAEIEPGGVAQRNLEASILLARMDLDKLRGLPLPEENSGKGSKGVSDQRGEPADESGDQEGAGEGEPKPEARDARGMGLGRRPDGIGS